MDEEQDNAPGFISGLFDGLLSSIAPQAYAYNKKKAMLDYERQLTQSDIAQKTQQWQELYNNETDFKKKGQYGIMLDNMKTSNILDAELIGKTQHDILTNTSSGFVPTEDMKEASFIHDQNVPEQVRSSVYDIVMKNRPYDQRMLAVNEMNAQSNAANVKNKASMGGSGGAGGAGGVGGKKQVMADQKVEGGKSQLKTLIKEVENNIAGLDSLNALSSPSKSTGENIVSAARNSPVGQFAGRAIGSQEQTFRDNINNLKPRILNSIMAATGMSAKQLDSNVELQTMLNSLGSMGQSKESQLNTLRTLEKTYLSGNLPESSPNRNTGSSAIESGRLMKAIRSGTDKATGRRVYMYEDKTIGFTPTKGR